jgi:cell division protein FtsB
MSDPDRRLSNRPLRLLALLLLALFAWLQYRLWFGEGGATATAALQDKVDRQAAENRGLRQRNAQLAAEVDDLKSGEAAAEERARSELGMIKPGETFYRVVETPVPAPLPESDAEHAAGDAAEDAP